MRDLGGGYFYRTLNKDGKEIKKIYISLLSVGIICLGVFLGVNITKSSYALFSASIKGEKTIEVEVEFPKITAEIISKVGTDGIVAESHPATTQLKANTDYRYTGANPNNYVRFNNELWRIIGVFPTDDGTGKIENRVKLIRSESIGNYAWDNKPSGTGSSTSFYGSNNWSDSALQVILNSGAYYNRTNGNCPYGMNGTTIPCDFSDVGLTAEAKNMIGNAKWYLGGSATYNDVTTNMFYTRERGIAVYSGRPTNWVGKVGLMYPSDYGYATSGGDTTNKKTCLNQILINWENSNYNFCANNNWLYVNNHIQWLLTSRSDDNSLTFAIFTKGSVSSYAPINSIIIKPVVYLKSGTKMLSGTGTSSNPYTLS